MIGTNLSQCRITAKLGEGGMGSVYEASDESPERSVALESLPSEVVRNPDRVRHFGQEAKSDSCPLSLARWSTSFREWKRQTCDSPRLSNGWASPRHVASNSVESRARAWRT